MTRRCAECGAPFTGERWQRLCWTCWREQRDEKALKAAWERGYDHGYAHGYRDGSADQPRALAGVARDLLDQAVRLTHPDRHPAERAAEANAVTARLLELRERAA